MHPVRTFGIMLPDELIKVAMRPDPIKPPLALRHVTVDAEVCGFALHVLGIAHAANGIIQSQRPIAASDFHRMPHRRAQRLDDVMHQGAQIHQIALPRIISDAFCLRSITRRELLQREVLAYLRRHFCDS